MVLDCTRLIPKRLELGQGGDFGTRYQSKLFNPAFLKDKGLPVPEWLDGDERILPKVFED